MSQTALRILHRQFKIILVGFAHRQLGAVFQFDLGGGERLNLAPPDKTRIRTNPLEIMAVSSLPIWE